MGEAEIVVPFQSTAMTKDNVWTDVNQRGNKKQLPVTHGNAKRDQTGERRME